MREKDNNNFLDWLKKEKYSVSVTLFAAILPSIFSFFVKEDILTFGKSAFQDFLNRLFQNNVFNSIQLVFIFITIFVLISYQTRTRKDLVQCKAYIIQYIKKNTNRKIKNPSEVEAAYDLVKTSVIQFYRFWIIVWLLWLAYYLGGVVFSYTGEESGWSVYGKFFDFLNSTTMMLIYIGLYNITVHSEIRRNEDKSSTWYGILFWFVIFVLFFILLLCESTTFRCCDNYSIYNGLLVSSFAAIVFVMVLGKLNSHYLQVPRFFMIVMYFHAIIQMYNPIVEMIRMNEYSQNAKDLFMPIEFLQYVVPLVTLAGKVCLMFTLCWMVDKKRLIFFIIHRSAAMEITQNLLSELDQEPVDF